MKRYSAPFIGCLVLLSLLSGCTLAPKYTRPAAPVPSAWPSGEAYDATATAEAPEAATRQTPWRDFLTDARLQKTIDLALTNNRDLRLAMLNVERARAMYGIQRDQLFPAVTASAGAYVERVPADLSQSGSTMTTEKYSANIGVLAWEMDFFGRIQALKDNAWEEYIATAEAQRSAQILLVSTVANAYLTFAADRDAVQLAADTLAAQEETYKLIAKRYDIGLASALDLRRVESQVEAARGEAVRATQQAAQDENALVLLLGAPMPKELSPSGLDAVSALKDVKAGLPSDVLLLHPDVLASEHHLRAANANIGAARAAFFPRIALTSTFGTESADLSNLFKSGQGNWTFVPQITMPIFDARTWYAYRVTKVDKEIAITRYEKAIQTAFRDMADALAVRGTIQKRLSAQQSLVQAVAETYRLSNIRYFKGIDSYLNVLDAQRSLDAARQGLIQLRLAELTSRITLYKVLGGGGA